MQAILRITLFTVIAAMLGVQTSGCANQFYSVPLLPSSPRVLLVMTNHADMGDTGEPTGLWLDEASHPWAVFVEAGFDVVLASPEGGFVPFDPRSLNDNDADDRAFLDAFAGSAGAGVPGTVALGAVDAGAFDAVFFSGGHGTMWDFPVSEAVKNAGESVYRSGGVVAAVCHGPAALVRLETPSGSPLVSGRRLAAFTDDEERAVELEDAVPFMLETRLRELGADVVLAPNFEENVVVDGRLVTGQNPASARGTAEAVVRVVRSGE